MWQEVPKLNGWLAVLVLGLAVSCAVELPADDEATFGSRGKGDVGGGVTCTNQDAKARSMDNPLLGSAVSSGGTLHIVTRSRRGTLMAATFDPRAPDAQPTARDFPGSSIDSSIAPIAVSSPGQPAFLVSDTAGATCSLLQGSNANVLLSQQHCGALEAVDADGAGTIYFAVVEAKATGPTLVLRDSNGAFVDLASADQRMQVSVSAGSQNIVVAYATRANGAEIVEVVAVPKTAFAAGTLDALPRKVVFPTGIRDTLRVLRVAAVDGASFIVFAQRTGGVYLGVGRADGAPEIEMQRADIDGALPGAATFTWNAHANAGGIVFARENAPPSFVAVDAEGNQTASLELSEAPSGSMGRGPISVHPVDDTFVAVWPVDVNGAPATRMHLVSCQARQAPAS